MLLAYKYSRLVSLSAFLFVIAVSAPAQPPPRPPYGVEIGRPPKKNSAGQQLAQVLQTFNCLPFKKLGYLCDSSALEGFSNYEWTHADLNIFARQFRLVYLHLKERSLLLGNHVSLRIALQGEADSQAIHRFKLWSEVESRLGRLEGRNASDPITNPDLAWLRSKAVYEALRQVLPLETVKILEPVEHKAPSEDTGKYRAARIYIAVE